MQSPNCSYRDDWEAPTGLDVFVFLALTARRVVLRDFAVAVFFARVADLELVFETLGLAEERAFFAVVRVCADFLLEAFCLAVRFFTTGSEYVAGIKSTSPGFTGAAVGVPFGAASVMSSFAAAIREEVTLYCCAIAGSVSPALTRCARQATRFSSGT